MFFWLSVTLTSRPSVFTVNWLPLAVTPLAIAALTRPCGVSQIARRRSLTASGFGVGGGGDAGRAAASGDGERQRKTDDQGCDAAHGDSLNERGDIISPGGPRQ